MTKQTIFILLLIFIGAGEALSQDKVLSYRKLEKEPTYTSLEEAAVNPSLVYKLDLSNAKPALKEIPAEIKDFKNLQELNLSGNKIKELPAWLFGLTNLQKLEMSSNYIKELPAGIKNLNEIRVLDISGCQFTELPVELAELEKMEEFYLFANFIETFPAEMAALKKLRKINFLKNKLSAEEVEKIHAMFPKAEFDAF